MYLFCCILEMNDAKYDHYLDFEEEFFVENNKPKTKKKKSYRSYKVIKGVENVLKEVY